MTITGALMDADDKKLKLKLWSRNRVQIRGEINSDIETMQGGYKFYVRTCEDHKGKTHNTNILVLAGVKLKEKLELSTTGDFVEVEGLFNKDGIVVTYYKNISLAERELPQG